MNYNDVSFDQSMCRRAAECRYRCDELESPIKKWNTFVCLSIDNLDNETMNV